MKVMYCHRSFSSEHPEIRHRTIELLDANGLPDTKSIWFLDMLFPNIIITRSLVPGRTTQIIYEIIMLLRLAAENPNSNFDQYFPDQFFLWTITQDKVVFTLDEEEYDEPPTDAEGNEIRFEMSHGQFIKALLFWQEFRWGGIEDGYVLDLDKVVDESMGGLLSWPDSENSEK
jgi:hypothetical protein